MKELNVKIRYIDKNITSLIKFENGDLIDLRASRVFVNGEEKTFPCSYNPGDVVFFKLGFAMEMPKGYKANVYPRSSTYKNYGLILTNSVGQIDNTYNGDSDEWCGMFHALRGGTVNYDDRILQFEIVPVMPPVNFNVVEHLGNEDRGGYGTSGVK